MFYVNGITLNDGHQKISQINDDYLYHTQLDEIVQTIEIIDGIIDYVGNVITQNGNIIASCFCASVVQ